MPIFIIEVRMQDQLYNYLVEEKLSSETETKSLKIGVRITIGKRQENRKTIIITQKL